MLRSEAAVKGAGIAWTIVRPFAFMSNALRWRDQLREGDVVREPFANVPAAVIDPQDIAAVAASALRAEGHAGHTYAVSGPAALLPADRVRILGAALGRALRFEAQPDDEARAQMSAQMPAAYVDAFFDFYVDGSLDDPDSSDGGRRCWAASRAVRAVGGRARRRLPLAARRAPRETDHPKRVMSAGRPLRRCRAA